MEMARRQNDKRVIALFKEMKDMIEVLTRYARLLHVMNRHPQKLTTRAID